MKKFEELLVGLAALLIALLIIGIALKVIIESFGLIIVLIVLWYVYTHLLQKK